MFGRQTVAHWLLSFTGHVELKETCLSQRSCSWAEVLSEGSVSGAVAEMTPQSFPCPAGGAHAVQQPPPSAPLLLGSPWVGGDALHTDFCLLCLPLRMGQSLVVLGG